MQGSCFGLRVPTYAKVKQLLNTRSGGQVFGVLARERQPRILDPPDQTPHPTPSDCFWHSPRNTNSPIRVASFLDCNYVDVTLTYCLYLVATVEFTFHCKRSALAGHAAVGCTASS